MKEESIERVQIIDEITALEKTLRDPMTLGEKWAYRQGRIAGQKAMIPAPIKELRELARHYLWHDYVNAESEFEEVEALVALLKKVYTAGSNLAPNQEPAT